MSQTFLRRLSNLESHHRFAVTAVVAAIAFFSAAGRMKFAAQLIVTWDVYSVCLLALAWMRILSAKPRELVRLATLQHTNRTLIFVFVLAAAVASLGAVGYFMSTARGLPREPLAGHVIAAIGTVILSWLVVHTVFTLHYACLYYLDPAAKGQGGGLCFPGEQEFEADYLDFAYFSFVIGMTSQVSDIQVSSRPIRRWVLLHGMISFGFNAAILALSINIISSML